MLYLLKASLAWALFLLLFEVCYKRNGHYTINRIYLLGSVIAGVVLPLLSFPAPVSVVDTMVQPVYRLIPQEAAHPAAVVARHAPVSSWPVSQLLLVVYGAGVLYAIFRYLQELRSIQQLIKISPCRQIDGYTVYVTGRLHAPFSFCARIFLHDTAAFTADELGYIIRHEAAHSYRRHWLDLLVLRLVCTVCWFHPLVWRYLHLLRLQHEYEADALAANNDTYGYGHFLLQQALLGGVPAIAHSFYFSPIKNRIKMLTKKQTRPAPAWGYALTAPLLLCCTFLMASSAATNGPVRGSAVSSYQGNTFYWYVKDSFYNGNNRRYEPIQAVYQMNSEPVYQGSTLKSPASYGASENDYNDHIRTEFRKRCRQGRDSMTVVSLNNIVVDKSGTVVYYEAHYSRPYASRLALQNEWKPYPDHDPELDKIVAQLVKEGPKWKPAMLDGRAVNSTVDTGQGC